MKKTNNRMVICVAFLLLFALIGCFWGDFVKSRSNVGQEVSFEGIELVGGILPAESVLGITYWSGDTPHDINDEECVGKIVQALGEIQCVEYIPEEARAGFVKIELKYETQIIALIMQTDNVSIEGKHYRVNPSLSATLDLCREIVMGVENNE